jgi:hypothetical protein
MSWSLPGRSTLHFWENRFQEARIAKDFSIIDPNALHGISWAEVRIGLHE